MYKPYIKKIDNGIFELQTGFFVIQLWTNSDEWLFGIRRYYGGKLTILGFGPIRVEL